MNTNKTTEKTQKPEAVKLSWFQRLIRDKKKMTWITSAVCLALAAIIILIVVLGGQTAETDDDASSSPDPRKYETIKNGDFRYTFLEEEDSNIYRYPMAPDSWTSEVKVGNAVDENGDEIIPVEPDNVAGQNTRFGILNTEAAAYASLTEDDLGYIGRETGASRFNPGKPQSSDPDGEDKDDFSVSREKDPHDNILMLYAGEPNVSRAGINYKSSSFYVNAGEYAEVSVWVRTYGVTGADNAHIKIQTSEADELFFGNVVAADWTLYRFYVSTSLTYGQTVTLNLSLGYESTGTTDHYASGYAFFSDVSIRYINQREYNDAKDIAEDEANPLNPFIKYHNFRTETGSKELVYANGKFGTAAAPSTVVYAPAAKQEGKLYATPAPHARPTTSGSDTDKHDIVSLNAPEYEDYFEGHPFSGIDNALMIYNANYSSFGFIFVPGTSPDTYLSVGINRYYKLSVWVKTDEMVSGRGASIYLMNKNYEIDRDKYPSTYFEGIDTTKIEQTGKEYNSGWVEYSFYIQGSSAEVQNFYLELWLGKRGREGASASDADRAKGYAFFANVSLSSITMYEYQNISTGSTSKTLAISMKSSSSSVTNGSFDTPTNNDLYTYPLNPNGWNLYYSGHSELKYLTDSERYVNAAEEDADSTDYAPLPVDRGAGSAGIINTSVTLGEILNNYEKPDIKKAELKALIDPSNFWGDADSFWDNMCREANPGATGPNVLMIANHGETSFGLRSSSISLEANSWYRISVKVKTYNISGDGVNIYLSGLYDYETDADGDVVMDEDGNPVPADTIHADAQFNGIQSSNTGNFYAENVFELSGTSLVTHGYVEYSFLVITGDISKTVNLELWLGGREYNIDNRTSGYAFFDQARVDKLQVDEDGDTDKYAEALEKLRLQMPTLGEDEEYETTDYNAFFANLSIIDYSIETTVEEPWEDPGEEDEPFDFDLLLVPSLVIAAVLLLAVISVLGRKVFKNVKRKRQIKPSSDYKRKPVKQISYDIDDASDEPAAIEPEKAPEVKNEKSAEEYGSNKKSEADDTDL